MAIKILVLIIILAITKCSLHNYTNNFNIISIIFRNMFPPNMIEATIFQVIYVVKRLFIIKRQLKTYINYLGCYYYYYHVYINKGTFSVSEKNCLEIMSGINI